MAARSTANTTSPFSSPSLVDEATTLLAEINADPQRAGERARVLRDRADRVGDVPAGVVARRVVGLVAGDAGRLAEATKQFTSAITAAEAAGLRALAGEVRMSYAPTLLFQGDIGAALDECDRAIALLDGVQRARAIAQRAAIAKETGALDEVVRGYGQAIAVLRRHGDRRWEANVLHNRALVHWQRRQFASAAADFARAADLYDELGDAVTSARAYEHLGCVQAALGNLAEALGSFAEADRRVAGLALDNPLDTIDRALVLLAARLGEEALAAAASAADAMESAGHQYRLAEALLIKAEAALLLGDNALAASSAEAAAEHFGRRRASGQSAMARLVAIQASLAQGRTGQGAIAAARVVARDLWKSGLVPAAMDASIIAGQLELDAGRRVATGRGLAEAARRRGSGPILERVTGWHAEALRRLAAGDRHGAGAALRAGLRLADTHRESLGATELRVRSTAHATELAALGLRLALADGRPRRVLAWAERGRAGALRTPPARPPDDRRLATDLAELRSVSAAVQAALVEGADAAALQRRQRALEGAVQARSRLAKGRAERISESATTLADVLADLHGWCLVEFVESEGRFYAVVAGRGRSRLFALGAAAPVVAELDSQRFALRRATLRRGSSAAVAAADRGLDEGAARLDELLLRPLQRWIGDSPVVIGPTGALHGVAWGALPSLHDRPVTVSPSVRLWHRAHRRRTLSGPPVLVAGPRLAGAADEVAALARIYPEAARYDGAAARCADVAKAMAGARFAHIAAHGTFRADNPMFSTIELADGSLTVYDLEALRRPPQLVVLSACDSGRSSLHPGDELMGFAASLLAMGSRTLVASLVPVPDDATHPLMVSFHHNLRDGATAAAALAMAQSRARASGDPGVVAGAVSFVCLGAP